MPAESRNYTPEPGYTGDFYLVSDFLHRVCHTPGRLHGMEWVRWEWSFAKEIQDKTTFEKAGLWEEGGVLVAAALFEGKPGQTWLVTDASHETLRPEMLQYALENLCADGKFQLSIADGDADLQKLAFRQGLRPTQSKEQTAVMDITDEATQYALPEGYRIVSFADEFDIRKYNRIMWRGFDNGRTPPDDDSMLEWRKNCVTSPHANPDLQIAVAAPDGSFVAHCEMWHVPGDGYAIVEPVCTDPDYRGLGLGRAAVLEAVRRCGERGATEAFVGSSQQFYYSIGFRPCRNDTFWAREA